MKKYYEIPSIRITFVKVEDVILASKISVCDDLGDVFEGDVFGQ